MDESFTDLDYKMEKEDERLLQKIRRNKRRIRKTKCGIQNPRTNY